MHAAQIYAEMLGQVCHRNLYADPRMFQEVELTCSLLTDRNQAFVLHARHATFYLFYAKFPNTYLRDIAAYGANYRQQVHDPQPITIKQSVPFRMRYPKEQASFFRLFANVLYYLVTGNSSVGYLAKDESNPYYRKVTGLDVPNRSPLWVTENRQNRYMNAFNLSGLG